MIIVISKSLKIQEHIISGYGGVYFGNLEEFLWDLEAFVDAVHLWSFVRDAAARQQKAQISSVVSEKPKQTYGS